METNIIAFILIVLLLIIKSIQFTLQVQINHPNNKIHKKDNE